MLFAITFPQIDPVLFSIGPLAVRWYALSYVIGLALGWRLLRHRSAVSSDDLSADNIDDFLVWATIGIILGGRLGYVLFYNLQYFLVNPSQIFATWRGGMSFHGGLLGVVVAGLLFCRRYKLSPLNLGDALACVSPIGLLFGRIANFINGELYGRVTDAPWGVVFPHAGPEPRHPSQLYEAFLEGLVLFVVLNVMWRSRKIRANCGVLTGTFIAGYAIARMIVELFRQPDPQIGFLTLGSTMGQWLSVPMLIIGVGIIIWGLRRAG